MGTTGAIKTITSGGSIVLPVTSSHAVLINEIKPDTIPGNTLAAKLEELDKSISDIKTVTDTILEDGDLSITYINNPEENLVGLRHTNTISNPPTKEAIYKFKIDKNGHITDIKEAGLEDFGIGMPIKYYGEYPTNNTFTPSVGEMYLVNTGFISKYNKGDVNDFAIYDGVKFNIILSDINPNIQLNNSDSRIYGTGGVTNIYAPTELGDAGYVLATNSTKDGLEWKNIPTTNVKLDTQGNKLTIGDKTISFTGENGISVNSNSTNTITVRSLYSYNEDDFEISGNTISLKNPQEQVTLSAGDGIDISTNTVSVKVDSDSAQYLTVGEDGLKLSGIESAVSKQISESINKLSGSKKGDGTHVKVTVTQTDGKITDVAVSEKNIVSTADLANEISVRKAADTELDSRIDTLETSVDSMNRAYPHIINEIYGDGTTNDWNLDKDSRIDILTNNTLAVLKEIWGENHNYDWSKSSRIDKLGNVFNWGLRFSEGIILAPHNNGIIVPANTTEKIYLPRYGKCEIGYTITSDSDIKVTFGNVSVECKKKLVRRASNIKLFLSEPYLTIQSSGGKAYLTDIVIYFEDGPINICPTLLTSLINNDSISKTIREFEYDNRTNSDICQFTLSNASPGFYQFTYSIKGSNIKYRPEDDGTTATYYTIASLLWNIETMPGTSFTIRPNNNNYHYYTTIDFYTLDCKVCNDIDETVTGYTTFQTIYYIPKKQKVTLYLRTFNLGTFDVKDISFKPISWSNKANVAEEANNLVSIGNGITTAIIGGSTLIKSDSSYFNFTTDSDGDVILQYIKNNEILWTLGKNFSNTELESIKYTPELDWFKLDGDTMPDGVFTSADSGSPQNILLGYLNTTDVNTLYKGTDNRYYENNTGTLILNSYAKQITKQLNSIGEEYYMKITPRVNGMLMITTGYYIKNSTGAYTWVDEPLIQG